MSTDSLPTAMTKVAVLGGTGQVGTELVDALIREPSVQEVRLFSRRASTDPRIVGNPKVSSSFCFILFYLYMLSFPSFSVSSVFYLFT